MNPGQKVLNKYIKHGQLKIYILLIEIKMLNIICSAQGLNIENERFSAGLNNPINHKIWSCSWSTCSKNMLQLGQITQAIHTQHTAKVDNMFVCDGTVSLSSASDLSVFLIFFFTKAVISTTLWKKTWPCIFSLYLYGEWTESRKTWCQLLPGLPNPEMNLKQKDESKAIQHWFRALR